MRAGTIGVRGIVPSQSPPFFAVISIRQKLLDLISSGRPPGSFRLYAGYTGWTARQLQNEVVRGLWTVLPANASAVFNPHPETLWRRLTPPRPIR